MPSQYQDELEAQRSQHVTGDAGGLGELHQLALAAGGLGTWNYDFITGEVYWDERCRNLFGLTKEDRVAYERAIGIIHKDDRLGVDEAVKAALEPGSTGVYEREYRVVWPDGSEHWLEARGQAFFQGEGGQRRPVRFIGTVRDVTERRQLKDALAFLASSGANPNENFFRSLAKFLAETLGFEFACIDRLEGGGRWAARTVAFFYEGNFQNDVTYTLEDTACGELVTQVTCCFPSGVRARFPRDKVLQEMAAESYAGVTLRNYQGRPIGLIALIGRRPLWNPQHAESLLQLVAGRAAGEMERQQTEHALRQNQERLVLAQQAGQVGVFELDFQAQTRFWSPERKALFGLPAEFEPREGSWSSHVNPEDDRAAREDLRRAFGALRQQVVQSYRITRPDGQKRWLEDRALVTYDNADRPLRMVGTSMDITAEVERREGARKRQRHFYFSAARTVAVLAAALFLENAVVMRVLANLPEIGLWWSILIDSLSLMVMVSPVLYYFAFRPFVTILQQRDVVEEALRQTNETLESRVNDRTASLELANRRLESEVLERKQVEAALRESRKDLDRAQLVAHAGSWRLNVQTNELSWSDENWRIFGVPRGTPLTYETFLKTVHPEDHSFVHAKWMAALRGEPYDIEHRILVGDTVKWVRERAELEFGPDGTLQGGFGITQDITARKRAEAALVEAHAHLEHEVQRRTAKLNQTNEMLRLEIQARRETEEKIKAAELRYRTVADFTHDWEYWRLPDGALSYCSPSCERVSGYTAAELTAAPDLIDTIVHPDDRPVWEAHRRGAVSMKIPLTVQFRITTKAGTTRWLEHVCTGVIGPAGEYLGIRACNRDITDRQRAELETQRLRQELSRVSRVTMAGQLAAAIAHELNQPLGAILVNTQSAEKLLRLEPPDLQEVLETLRDIRTDSQRAGAVLQHLRSLFRNTGRSQAAIRLNDVVQATVSLMQSEFVLRGITFRLELGAGMSEVLGNATELQQVILNLVLNAMDVMAACEPGRRQLTLTTSESTDSVLCSVSDTGPGIPPETLTRIFEPFFSTKSSGMGIGLAICHAIIEAHGGRLWAHNNPAGGATVQFTLPRRGYSS